jgi:predicted Zn-dependent peptidase
MFSHPNVVPYSSSPRLPPRGCRVSESIRQHTFSNGLVLVAEPMDWLESAAFTLLVPSGCVDDPIDRAGLSSFTCETAFRGAGPRDSRRFIEDLDNLGVERSESVSDAHTQISAATLAANLPQAIAVFADVLRVPHFNPEQLEPARLAMLQELRAVQDEPAERLMIELRRRHYPYPWGRPPQGEADALEAISMDEIRSHFSTHYRPNGTVLGVAGRFDWPVVCDTVGRLLGDWQPVPEEPRVEKPRIGGWRHMHYDSSQTHVGIAYPSVPYADPDYFQAWGAVGVLSGGTSARLFTIVREQRGLCYTVDAHHHTLRARGAVFCYAATTAERAQKTLDVLLAELIRLRRGVEPGELDRLKSRITSALVMQQESSSARSASIARDWYHLGAPRTMDQLRRLVDALSCASINKYLDQHPPGDFTVVTLGSRELEAPDGIS